MSTRAILSDHHAFAWSQFSRVNSDGVNSRLQIVIDEMLRAADELIKAGGHQMIFAGDLFHVRGSIDPEVFNPVQQAIKKILDKGIDIAAIPGNHDLKGKETTELGNAIQSLDGLGGKFADQGGSFKVVTNADMARDRGFQDLIMVPWQSTPEKLREEVQEILGSYTTLGDQKHDDLIIHAPVNGVLEGIPDHGLSPAEMQGWGFHRVFAGHYHNHKDLGGGIYSIGATAHHTWKDVGSKAGFLIVNDDEVKWFASHAPEFVDITGETDPEDIPLVADGNYVRVRDMDLDDAGVQLFRKELLGMGAAGISFQIAKKTVSARGPASGKALGLAESISAHIEKMGLPNAASIQAKCSDILSLAQNPAV